MKSLFFLSFFIFLLGCDDAVKDEIYNENNTSVSGGIVYDTDEQPINGLYRVYYPDGTVKMEIQSKNGKPDGNGRFYNEDGELYFQGTFTDGKPNGTAYNYFANGNVHNEMNYVDGVKQGSQKSYDKDGKLVVEVIFEDGNPVSGYAIINDEKEEFSAEELAELK